MGACSVKVLTGIINVIIGVAVDVIHQEANAVLRRDDESGVGKKLKLLLGQNVTACLKIATCIRFVQRKIAGNEAQVLLVVLCGNKDAQPVVNSGSPY